jgi:hypothetical protein
MQVSKSANNPNKLTDGMQTAVDGSVTSDCFISTTACKLLIVIMKFSQHFSKNTVK